MSNDRNSWRKLGVAFLVAIVLSVLSYASVANAQQKVPAPAGSFWLDTNASPQVWVPSSPLKPFPVNATVTASIGGFAPSLAYATCTATASSCASTALPTNTGTVVLFNTGTTTVSCTLAAGAATALANELQIPASSGLPIATVYSATTYDHFACIDQTGSVSNLVVASGGTGLGTGWGGGSAGGGGGGAVTMASGAVASGAYSSGSIASGAMVDLGAIADAAATVGSTGTLSAKLRLMTSQLDTINTNIQAGAGATGSAVPSSGIYVAGNVAGNLRGWTGVNPSGSIFAQQVDTASVAGTTTATGSGAMNGGTQRMALATDSPGIVTLGQTTKSASVPVTMASDQYVDPCGDPTVAKSSVPISVTSATTTQLVAISGSTVVYVCGFSMTISPSGTSADTALFEYGTGSNCATGTTSLTGTYGNGDLTSAAAVVPVSYGGAGMTIFKTAAANALCILTAGTAVSIQGVTTFVQK